MRRAVLALLTALLLAPPAWSQGPAPSARAPGAALQRDLDRAFEALREAPDDQGARMAEAVIRQLWSRQASAAVALLLNRGIRNLRGNNAADALEDFDAAIMLAPTLADAWHWRAQANAAAGETLAAAADLRECLRLEPRHFPALVTLPGCRRRRAMRAARCAASRPRWRCTRACPAAPSACAS